MNIDVVALSWHSIFSFVLGLKFDFGFSELGKG